jgi:hypothetical protein
VAEPKVQNRKKLKRIVTRLYRTGKPGLIEIMMDFNPGLRRKDAESAYDLVTAAINGWLRALTRELPKGLHAKLLLTDWKIVVCFFRL